MRRKFKKGTLLAASALAVCTLSLSVGFAVADGNTFQGGEIADNYTIYSTLNLPTGSFGQTQATALVTYPDGNVVTADKALQLNQGGVYGVEYRAVVDGKMLKHTDSFTVDMPLYSLSNEDSTAVYGVDENNVWSSWNSGREGLMLSLAPKDVFRYNDVINVYESSVSNYAFQFAFAPTTVGKSDAQAMYVSFTDIYNPDNKVTIWIKANTGASVVTYVSSKANDQPWVGREWHGSRGEIWQINNAYGTPAYISSGGAWYGNPNADQLDLGFYFNQEKNQLWYRANKDNNSTGEITNDFDDLKVQVDPWKGFTTGEVYVDVWCESYNADKMNLLIMSIGGQDLSRTELKDTQGPAFTLQADGLTEQERGVGYAGYSYPVANASASDIYSHGNVAYSVNAYYNYSRSTGEYTDFNGAYAYEVEIKDGYFETQYEGKYAVVYRAQDWYGNKTEKVYSVNVGKKADAPAIVGLTTSTPVTQAKAGNIVDLPVISGYLGGTGTLTPYYEVTQNGEPVEVLGNLIDGCYFVPQAGGTYTVVAGVRDALRTTQTETFEVSVATSNDPSIGIKAQLPKYLIAGSTYYLPKLTATDATGTAHKTTITVTDGNGTRDGSEKVIFKPDLDGNATITYQSGENTYTYVLPVITVKDKQGILQLDKYFVTDGGVSVETGELGMEITAAQDGSVSYIRELLCDYLSLQFTVSKDANEFNSLAITLTDAYDSTVSIRTEMTRNSGRKCAVYINGKDTGKRFESATFSTGTLLTYQFLGTSNTATLETLALDYETTERGEKFQGFPSGLAYVTIEFNGVETQSSIRLSAINGQRFNQGVYTDTTVPNVHVNGTFTRTVAGVGDVINVYSAFANDVLDPYTSLTVSVLCGNEYVTATDGTKLQNAPANIAYQFVVEHLGSYDIRYTAKDGSNKTTYAQYRYTIFESTKPTLTLEGEMKLNHSLGEITLPQATVSDDVTDSKNMPVYLTVTDPYGIVHAVKNYKFTATHKGMYEIIYSVRDEVGNTAIIRYVISVS